MAARIIRIVFGIIAGAMLVAALGDVLVWGRLTIISPFSFGALLALWPTAISYAISYLFIAIVWVNHHHLLRFPDVATHRLIWGNFAHLFAVSLLPFATACMARSRLAAGPVTVYAALFFLVDMASWSTWRIWRSSTRCWRKPRGPRHSP